MSDDLIERLAGLGESMTTLKLIGDLQGRIEAQAAEIEDLKKSLEIWIFHTQRAMRQKPDDARAYAKAWLFRNANGEEPE